MADSATTIPSKKESAANLPSFFWMVVIAFVLRVGWIVIAHTYKFKTIDDNFSFGFEMGRIGRSIASGHGFGNPFNEPTGPTAWEPPLYPFLIAGVFKLFGVYSHASALILLSINSVFSALTCIPIFLIARRCFSEKVAIWSGWLWAVLPPVMYWCTRWVWETSLAALLLAVIFWLALTLEEKDGWRPWLWFGLFWGIGALTNTSLLAFLPASGLWPWYRRWKLGKTSFGGVVLASAVFAVSLTPWLVRNHQTFGKFIFIRSNFGAELRLGNGPGANGTWMEYLHPSQNVFEMRRFREVGELAYVSERKREAIAFIREDYARFAGLSVKRFIYYWGGLPRLSEIPALAPFKDSVFLASSVLGFWGLGRALRQRKPGAWLFLWLILSYPTVYYFVFPHPRYRHPIEPELGILMVYVVSEAKKKTVK
ncbi:MAG TPA: glycosyltransferase family 39 protein [Terriglobales bacterium]|jgi:4-amino-4-deoxy-L-arabinose transferase-like glycosyltransferase|nr:glycosyltransferase family 39 protein [Terriglobales bacterium]